MLGFVLAVCILSTVLLWFQVLRGLDELSEAGSDDAQWTLGQVEIEFLNLLNAVVVAGAASPAADDAAALSEVRRRFDIFFSRMRIIGNGRLYLPVAERGDVRPAAARIQTVLAETVRWIDDDDDALRNALPCVRSALYGVAEDVRSVHVGGIAHFAAAAEAKRRAVARLVMQVAAVTIVLILALLGFAFLLFGLNRTATRRAADLAVAGERLSTIVETALDAIIVADRDGCVREYNAAAERIFGWPRAAAIGRPMTDLMIPEAHRAAHEAGMARYRETGHTSVVGRGRLQLEARHSDGSHFPVELSISRARDRDGEIFVSFLRDISSRVANERDLREARDRAREGERAKARFLAVMSHEMRKPLNGLLGSLELLEHTDLDEAQRGHLSVLRASGEHLLSHVNDVLDIARLDAAAHSFAAERVDPAAILDEIAATQRAAAARNGNTIALAMEEGARTTLLGDPRRLRHVLLNLLGNAIKFTRDGRIGLSVAVGPEGPDGRIVTFTVSDTGIGIAEADRDRIFEDFVTLDTTYGRRSEGTGLGLAITRRLVVAMGGEIGVESRPGEGSTFFVRLPMPEAPPEPAAPPAPAANPPSAPALHLLMVEDNEVNRAILRAFLARLGHAVDEAHDGEEGVRLAGRRRYDLILMDISMPRMSGVEASRAIRGGQGASRDVPIVAVTAHALPDELAAFRAAGIDEALTKPIRLDPLARVIAKALTRAADAPARA